MTRFVKKDYSGPVYKEAVVGSTVKLRLGGHPEGPYTVTSVEKREDGTELAEIVGDGRRFGVLTGWLEVVK